MPRGRALNLYIYCVLVVVQRERHARLLVDRHHIDTLWPPPRAPHA